MSVVGYRAGGRMPFPFHSTISKEPFVTSVVIPVGEDITAYLSSDDRWYVAVTNPVTGDTVLADSVTSAVVEIIDGYDSSDPAAAFEQRLDFVARTTAFQQGLLALASQEEGTLDVDTAGEDVLTALFGDRMEPADVDVWEQTVALVLVASHYEPYTDRRRPVGENVFLIDPFTELTLLLSLHAAGSLEVSFRDGDDTDEEAFAA